MPDFPTVLVTFARPEESRAFRRRLAEREWIWRHGVRFEVGGLGSTQIAVAHTGIGPEAAAASMDRLLSAGRWKHLIAAGFAGGLNPELKLGDVVVESRPLCEAPRLISRPRPIESVEEKARVFRETGAAAVDMETDAIAVASLAAGLQVTAVRVISDSAAIALPVPFAVWFDLNQQRPKPISLLAYLARHPSRIPPFIRFVRALNPVAQALAVALVRVVDCGQLHVDFDP